MRVQIYYQLFYKRDKVTHSFTYLNTKYFPTKQIPINWINRAWFSMYTLQCKSEMIIFITGSQQWVKPSWDWAQKYEQMDLYISVHFNLLPVTGRSCIWITEQLTHKLLSMSYYILDDDRLGWSRNSRNPSVRNLKNVW